MRVLLLGAGAVGSAIARGVQEGGVVEHLAVADIDPTRTAVVPAATTHVLDATDQSAIEALARAERVDMIVNACDPRMNPPIFGAAFAAGCHYLDMAMNLSAPGHLLGEAQLAASDAWRERGLLALVGMGVEPGLSDVFARYAADHLFANVDEVHVRDGSDLRIDGYGFAPTFSVWTTIEECLNPGLVWERERGWFTLPPFSEPETFVFPEGIGPVECVHVEHEEVVLIPRWVDCNRVTFKYGLGAEFIEVLRVLDKTGLASTQPIRVRGVEVAPRDVVAATLPDPAALGERMHGRTCAGTYVTGTGIDGKRRAAYLFHVADNQETMARHGMQAVAWQTAINPVIALELLALGKWHGAGVLGPEAFDSVPFLDHLRARGEEWKIEER
ncbi:MAG TPA: saccharopine dehydrogenase C-terminal domain-containing protein [Acidimicrobiia bacterium]|nr:saccharopine dehydrogenase C-terminal domain-containing protein [Acidimicrobiia bacterium]